MSDHCRKSSLEARPSPNARMLDWALAYRRLGWSVVPIPRGGKRPLVTWRDFETEPAAEDMIGSWYARWPDAGIAIVTGRISGIVVLDIDAGHGGEESFAALAPRPYALFETVESITGGGGRHLYFAHPGGTVPNRAGFLPGLDLRGNGGVVVAPPSLHASGHRYRWLPGAGPWDRAPVQLPEILRDRMDPEAQRGKPLHYWRDLLREGVPIGRRNSTIASLAGHLFWHDVDPQVATELLLSWNRVRCRPPLSDEEVVETVASIHRTHERHARLGRSLTSASRDRGF
ncbi:MAG TPA: bifunctional DNA primase/polymerase [Alphaproteobacteria bacterium]|nr:bifunctional DNA primase/polymerase [Alphaproteobacteria bacterium]